MSKHSSSSAVLVCGIFLMLLFTENMSLCAESKDPDSGSSATLASQGWAKAPARDTILAIEAKLRGVKGYAAKFEKKVFDPNGGLNSLEGTQDFLRPDKMRTVAKVLSAHNRDQVGSEITTIFDGAWEWGMGKRPPLTPERRKEIESMFPSTTSDSKMSKEEMDRLKADLIKHEADPSYSKYDLRQLTDAGISLREMLGLERNLLDPFGAYKPESIRLIKESATEWVLVAEFARETPWQELVTVDKNSGFVKKIEIEMNDKAFPLLDAQKLLLDVKEVHPVSSFADSVFQINIPADAHVMDNTDMILMDMKMAKEQEAEQGHKQTGPTRIR